MKAVKLPLLAILACVLNFTILAADAKPANILFFTKSTRYEHSVIAQKDGKPSFAEKILDDLGAKNNFKITTTKDGGAFTAENLAKYDALMFFTSGDLLVTDAKDKSAPMTAEGKALLLATVKSGKPFICVHNGLMTFNGSKDVDPYIDMIGGEGIGHDAQQVAKNTVVDSKFPGADKLGTGVEFMEEWYSNKNFAKDIHVILVQETEGMKGPKYVRPPFPATWARMYGKGRVFVTSMGHREDVWTNPAFQNMLVGGIQWALGRAEADITPNVEKVTPKYAELPASK